MRQNPNSVRAMAIGAVATALAFLGTSCSNDGNDPVDAADKADAIDASNVSQASSTADEPADGQPTDVTDAGPATSAPAEGRRPTGTAPGVDTGVADATGAPAPDAAPDASQPLSSEPPPTDPPIVTQPIDAGTRAFCDAVVAAETTFTRGPLIDFATATPEEIAAAGDQHAATLETLLGSAVAAVPAAIAPDVDTVVGFVRSSLASGEDVASNPDYRAADERVDVFVADSCGSGRVEVSAVEYAFDGLPTSLPAGRTTFVFTNSGAEIHEMVVFRINDGVTETIEELLALPEEEAFSKVVFAGATFGVQGETDLETFELTPGRYVALCFVPIGTADAAIVDSENAQPPGPPHFTAGMQAEFTVS